MFCLKCGKEIDDNATHCPYCNCPTENAGEVVFEEAEVVEESPKKAGGLGVAGIILGACSLVFSWLIAIIGWMLSGAGLALSIVGLKKGDNKAKVGIILSAIGIGCSFISSVVGAVLMMSSMM